MQEKLSEATLSRQGKEKAAHAIIKTLDDIEEEHRVTVSQLQGETASLCYLRSNFTPEQITECVKAIAKCEAKHTHLAKEVGRIKAEKELRVRNLIAKAHKERDATMKLEKRLRSKVYLCLGCCCPLINLQIAEVEEHKGLTKTEEAQLVEQLKVESFDRKNAEIEVRTLVLLQ